MSNIDRYQEELREARRAMRDHNYPKAQAHAALAQVYLAAAIYESQTRAKVASA